MTIPSYSKFLPDQTYLVTSYLNEEIFIWDWLSCEPAKILNGHINKTEYCEPFYLESVQNEPYLC